MMPVRTKPVRIFESDLGILRLIAGVEGRAPAHVLHSALVDYMKRHRRSLSNVFTKAQGAFATGDPTELAEILAANAGKQAADRAEQLKALR